MAKRLEKRIENLEWYNRHYREIGYLTKRVDKLEEIIRLLLKHLGLTMKEACIYLKKKGE